MSKEKKFRALIESVNREEKARVWAEIVQKENARTGTQKVVFREPKEKKFVWRKAAIAGGLSAVIAVTGVVIGGKYFGKGEPPAEQYYGMRAYTVKSAPMTLKERSETHGEEILLLDWYEDPAYFYTDMAYVLKESETEVGYYEEFSHLTTGAWISVSAIKNGYKLGGLESYRNTTERAYVDSVEISWRNTHDLSWAVFAYGKYQYYVFLEQQMSGNAIFEIVQEMFARAE